jgi:flagellar biosynthesis/type III secretory pathway ATPase
VRAWLAAYRDAEDLINIGAYTAGANPRIDEAVAQRERINVFLRQGLDERSTADESVQALAALATGH